MAPGPGQGKTPTTFDEGLQELYVDASRIVLAPDAPPQAQQFVTILQQGIMKFRQSMQQMKAQQAAGMAQQAAQGGAMGGPGGAPGGQMGAGGMGGPQPGGPPGMGGGGQPPGGGGPPGGAPNQIAPGGGAGMSGYGGVANPDDLQRILAGAGGQ